MAPLFTTLAFSLIAWLLIDDATSAWHATSTAEIIPDHAILAFGYPQQAPPPLPQTNREPTKPRHSKKDHRKTAQENELELEVAEQVSATVAATDMTACMTDFGCFGGI
jgi:predicted glycoside hydrolase/deacetylase ChbG (UPF0249 family)